MYVLCNCVVQARGNIVMLITTAGLIRGAPELRNNFAWLEKIEAKRRPVWSNRLVSRAAELLMENAVDISADVQHKHLGL